MSKATSPVLIVDDEPEVCQLIEYILKEAGLECRTTTDPAEARGLITNNDFSVMVTDVATGKITGLDLLAFAKQNRPSCKVVLVTGVPNTQYLSEALRLGAYDYIEKPFDREALTDTVVNAVNNGHKRNPLLSKVTTAVRERAVYKHACMDSTRALVRAAEAKDPYTRRHSEHVTDYAVAIATLAGLDTQYIENIRVASFVHDIGKIGVPDDILIKPGPLTDEEFEFIRRHPALGSDIINEIPVFKCEAELVRHHHERWNGRGYPDGLVGENIPLGSRVIHVADAIDAMLSPRSYKEAYGLDRVLVELNNCSGTQFDPKIAATAAKWCRDNRREISIIRAA